MLSEIHPQLRPLYNLLRDPQTNANAIKEQLLILSEALDNPIIICEVVGGRHCGASAHYPSIQASQFPSYDLIREPENIHDKNAIRVEWEGKQLGYIPKFMARRLAPILDAEIVLLCCPIEGDPTLITISQEASHQ